MQAYSTIPGRVDCCTRGASNGRGISAMPIREYCPPPLNRRIIIRHDDDETVAAGTDDLGRPLGPVTWPNQIETWASKRDSSGKQELPSGAIIITGKTVFTVRKQSGIYPDSKVIDDGIAYLMQSAPVEKGQRGGGFTHYQLYCERRTGLPT